MITVLLMMEVVNVLDILMISKELSSALILQIHKSLLNN